MPEKMQATVMPGIESRRIQLYSFAACRFLNWNVVFACENVLIAYTPRRWSHGEDVVTIETTDHQLHITSRSCNESFDFTGRYRKHISSLIGAINIVRESDMRQWNFELERLLEFSMQSVERAS